MTEIGRIAAAAVIAAICAVTVRKQTPEIGLLVALAASVLVLLSCGAALGEILAVLRQLGEKGGLSVGYMEPVVKVLGISFVARIAGEVCRDAKEGGLASAVETAGAVLALFTMLPLVEGMVSLLTQML